MRVLGAVLAGGRSSRFGSDKCDFVIREKRLIEHAIDSLAGQVDQIAVCGRAVPALLHLADRPCTRLGPLGGLNAALNYAAVHGFDAVLSAPCDVLPLPANLLSYLGSRGPSHLRNQHAVGCWPARLARELDRHIEEGNRSVRSWIAHCGSREVDDRELRLCNLNSLDQVEPLLARLKA